MAGFDLRAVAQARSAYKALSCLSLSFRLRIYIDQVLFCILKRMRNGNSTGEAIFRPRRVVLNEIKACRQVAVLREADV